MLVLLKVSEETKATIVKALTSTMPKANRFITPFFSMSPQLLSSIPMDSNIPMDFNPESTVAKKAYLNFVGILNLAVRIHI
ncbi:hypothetical protein [Methanosarcina barkeri]|uniref:hypothetical protein n=1 Tax=Methanosarcina barkeri TaxID=2208 RepID=UPI0018B0DFA5|nr:hypothetical protein [Methanosarcina barkeri]